MRSLALVSLVVGCSFPVTEGPSDAGAEPATRTMLSPCPGIPTAPADRPTAAAELLFPEEYAYAVAVDDKEIFFSKTPGGFGVDEPGITRAIDKTTGAVRTVCSGGTFRIEIDERYLYVGDARVDKKSGAIEELPGMRGAFDFALDGDWLYFVSLGAVPSADGWVARMPKAGGDVQTLARGLDGSQGISVYQGYVYFVEYHGDRIDRVPVGGGAVETVASGVGEHFPRATHADCHDLFYSVGNYGDAIRRLSFPLHAAPDTLGFPGGSIAVDQASVFVVNATSAVQISRFDGTKRTLGAGTGMATYGAVAVDDEAVYWVSTAGLMRAKK
ncbi:MAG: hypothetical protein ACXWUG_03680 [Polyangiales bacterium]